ncbi:Homeobox protein engrailed-2-A [Holothuria leucospilota]|uniref:Homeobox protein engrailed-2-A n=1 Tax=Holothuria leucospilota TaxID=206669 RepID=A0A9Q1C0A5_HOLLE|nr:Homeobox protein engrailed-2-A [Holothuria leucospilota]
MTLFSFIEVDTMADKSVKDVKPDSTYTTQSPSKPGESPSTWPKLTNFSIDNILRKDFGNSFRRHEDHIRQLNRLTVENIFRTNSLLESQRKKRECADSKVISEKPVTKISDKSTNSASINSPLLWPAWVYCTRYSDRPSSGKLLHLSLICF